MMDWLVAAIEILLTVVLAVLLAPWLMRAAAFIFWWSFHTFDRYMSWVMSLGM